MYNLKNGGKDKQHRRTSGAGSHLEPWGGKRAISIKQDLSCSIPLANRTPREGKGRREIKQRVKSRWVKKDEK